MGLPFQRERRGRQRADKSRRKLEKSSAAEISDLRRNTSRNRSRQFGGAVPGQSGPPAILQNTASSLLSGGGGLDPFVFQNRRR